MYKPILVCVSHIPPHEGNATSNIGLYFLPSSFIFQVLSTEFRRRALVGEVRLSKPNQALIERFGDVKKRLMAGAGKVRRGE